MGWHWKEKESERKMAARDRHLEFTAQGKLSREMKHKFDFIMNRWKKSKFVGSCAVVLAFVPPVISV